MIHLKRYFAALTVMLTLMAAYALGIAPWLEPEPAVRRRGESATNSVTELIGPTSIDLAALFTAGSWELDNPKIVETETCILLVKDYRPTSDGKLELTPCTLIFFARPEGENGPRRPIIMQAPQGAVLQFDRPLDIAQAQFGRLEGGLLPGPITIRSPESTPGQGDDLHLTTRNIQIDRDRVFTPHEVEFRYGESHGRGSDLTIHLLPKDPEDPRSGVGGLKSLILARLDRLHLVVPGKVGLPGLPVEASADNRRTTELAADASTTTTQLEVLCQGPVSFDMARERLLLDDGVEIERLLPGAPPDRLSCRQLQLVFREEETARGSKDNAAAQVSAPGEPMPSATSAAATSDPLAGRLKKLIAIGNPARLEAPSSATVVTAATMTLRVDRQQIYLDPSDEIPTVSLRQGASHFTAHRLDYELAPAGRLGKLLAIGPGELSFIQATGRELQTISARWRDELSIRPQDDDHRLSLTGEASVGVDPLGTFAAEQLHFWLREVEVPRDPTPEPDSRAAEATAERASPPARKYTLLPARLLATAEPVTGSPARPIVPPAGAPLRLVTLNSPRLSVETRRLEVWFQNQPAVVALPAVAERLPPTSLPREKPLKEPSLSKFSLVGDLIQMQVIRRGDEAELEDLIIRGGVSIDEVETDDPGQPPVRLRGDSLELRGGVTGSGTINIVGQPAEVGGRGMWLAGGTIHVVRKDNQLWIDGPGEAKFPASAGLADGALGPLARRNAPAARVAEPLVTPGDLPAEKVKPPEDVHVVWRDRFHFDGQTALLEGDVQARTATQLASGKSLEVNLSERINLAETASPADAALARLKFDGGVTIENRTLDEHGEQIAFDTLAVHDLVIDAAAGTLTAAGPGSLVSRRLASAALPGVSSPLPTPIPMPTSPPGDPNAPPKLNFIHIEFQGGIVGNIAQRQIEFQNQVRTIFAPIEAWDQSVAASRLEDLGEKGVLLTSDRLTVLEMAPAGQTPWIEAFASGGAVVEGKEFTVQAPRIAFTSDKELLTIEGDGFKEAELWHRRAPGEPSSYAAARKWSYWLRSGTLSVEGSKEFNIQQLPAGLLRLPGGRR
ncbi:MAG: hypothetical protein MUF06_01840 [Pirellulaceae bacterium]|nr:hypothetical protein [Pirellulaceae bacterium]